MFALRRVFFDGADRPELVLIHYTASLEGSPHTVLARSTAVVPRSEDPGRREVLLFLPSPPGEDRILVRYIFSTVHAGAEWFSPPFEILLPGPSAGDDLVVIEEEGEGNAKPAAGWGTFRLALPLRGEGSHARTVRFGFGAMRKKPSASLCRASVTVEKRSPPVVEVPEALSVLKNRPMPFFLYHLPEGGGLVADKINCARITFRDGEGDVACARLIWGDRLWAAQNLSVMEVKNFSAEETRASGYFFAEEKGRFLRQRSAALSAHPLPRTYEAFVFGPSGSVVEYCFQLLRRGDDGSVSAVWANSPSGGNWSVTL